MFLHSCLCSVVTCTLLAFGAAPALAQPGGSVLPLSKFKDQYDPVVRVSAPGMLVGATTQGQSNLITPVIRMPKTDLPRVPVCVQTTSRDATYWGQGELTPERLRERQGNVRWTYADEVEGPSKHRQMLTRMVETDLAVLAFVGACDSEGRTETVVVVDRGDGADPSRSVVLYLLSPDHEVEVSYTTADGRSQKVGCQEANSKMPSRGFDKTCVLGGPFAAVTAVEIERRRFDRLLRFSVRLVNAAAQPAAR